MTTLDQRFEALLREGVSPDYDEQHGGFVGNQVKCAECGTLNPAEAENCRDCGFSLEDAKMARRKTAVKTQDGFEMEPNSGDRVYFAVYPNGDTWQSIGPFATLQWASDHAGPAGFVIKSDFGVVAYRKQAGPYGSADDSPMAFWWRANQEGVVGFDDPAFDVLRETNDMSLAMDWDDPRFPRLEQTAERLMSSLLLSPNEQAQEVGEDLRDKLRSLKTGSRKQAQDNPYGGGDRANPYFDPAPSQQSGPSYVPAPEEVTRPVTTRPRGGGDAGPDIEDQDTFTEDGQGFDMTEDRTPEVAEASLDKVAVRCADCGQHGKLALSKVNDDLACRCGSTDVDLDDLVPDPDRIALNAIARDIRKANPDLPRERIRTMAKRAHDLAKGS